MARKHGYKYYTEQTVYVDGVFSHNKFDEHIVVAETPDEANEIIKNALQPGRKHKVGNGSILSITPEYVRSVVYLGRARYIRVTEYEMPDSLRFAARQRIVLSKAVGMKGEKGDCDTESLHPEL